MRRGRAAPPRRLRVLTAVPICDGHDSAIMTVNQELAGAGAEVVYLGFHRSAADIARAAVQEDADAIGISSYNGGHVDFAAELGSELSRRRREDIRRFAGGGATIRPVDVREMRALGVERVYGAGTPLDAITADIFRRFGRRERAVRPTDLPGPAVPGDDTLGRWVSLAEARAEAVREQEDLLRRLGEIQRRDGPAAGLPPAGRRRLTRVLRTVSQLGRPLETLRPAPRPPVIGFAGPGGVGKSTLIDELVLRHVAVLGTGGGGRIAVVCNDPSLPPGPGGLPGALLADRATMICAQDDRVFQRSLATRGGGGVAGALVDALKLLSAGGFRAIYVESAGTGQEAVPFAPGVVDATVLVLSPDYGGRLQLEKLALLRVADLVVLNKADRPSSAAAAAELRARPGRSARKQPFHATAASRHRDPGVDALFAALQGLAAGGRHA